MKCPKCGAENEEGTKFCVNCGTPLTAPLRAQQNSDSYVPIAKQTYVTPTARQSSQNGRWVIIVAAGVFLGLCAFCVCISAFISLPSLVPKTTHKVNYFVASVKGASVTYNNENGDSAQEDFQQQQWSKDFTATSGAFLYLSAQTKGDFVGCIISVDGYVFKETQSTGQYSIATCSGRLP